MNSIENNQLELWCGFGVDSSMDGSGLDLMKMAKIHIKTFHKDYEHFRMSNDILRIKEYCLFNRVETRYELKQI